MKIQDFVRLECTTGGHNKFYEIWLEAVSGSSGYNVCFKYGAIGQPGVGGIKRPDLSYAMATHAANDLKYEKTSKGYKQVSAAKGSGNIIDAGGFATVVKGPAAFAKDTQKSWPDTQAMKNPVGIMQPTDWPLKDAKTLLETANWGMQQKMNGKFIRVVVSKNGAHVQFFNKLGKEVQIPQFVGTFKAIHSDVALDCEALKDRLYAFDMPSCEDVFQNRYLKLLTYVGWAQKESSLLEHVPMYTDDQKAEKFAEFEKSKQEGVVFKALNSPYIPGKTENQKAASSLKVKFWKEASVIATGFTDKSSLKLVLVKGGKMVSVGKVTVPDKYKPQLKKFECVVRVRYLYATKGDQLYQPTLDPDDSGNIVRDDIEPTDYPSLSIKQLQYEGVADEDEPIRSIIV